jgi:NADH dehydrogenase
MAGKQATVFGGSGFLGRYVVKRLAEAGWRIFVGVRHPERAGFLRPMGDVGQVVPIKTNITDPDAVAAAVEGSDLVINTVGILFEKGAQRFAAVHAQGAERVAKAAQAQGAARLIHVSAIGADAASPSVYARSKAAGEAAVTAAFEGATIIRPSLLIGPEDDFFNRFAALARIAPALPLIDGGHTKFQPIYVGDVADAILAAVDDPATAGQVFELGGPAVYTFRELMVYVLKETGRRRVLASVPAWMIKPKAWFLEFLPKPPLTRDQIALLASDNIVATDPAVMVGRIGDLGITPTPMEAVAPDYLSRYRRGGGLQPSRFG